MYYAKKEFPVSGHRSVKIGAMTRFYYYYFLAIFFFFFLLPQVNMSYMYLDPIDPAILAACGHSLIAKVLNTDAQV